ncbi:hypothetical protein UFOVP45_112 [uncultured Caudovirales phage]|uniref:Uncharacterized protein n=1 Tax=uncultured Caudovirales phage TaxID=2100421 RepID=A0A6J5KQ69_9CAUD|nr:hypothetical protein UFOVP45_112 [uncultured Caudovirales phage]
MSNIIITDDEWDEQYTPILNHINGNDSQMFETYGDELAFVQSQPANRVWTMLDGDEGGVFIVNGMHLVNRIGYYITEKPFNENDFITLVVQRDGECLYCEEIAVDCECGLECCAPVPDEDLLRKSVIEEDLF